MKITIPTPCHENWEAMTPEEKGRFCSVCSKTVRDFTVASDDEIRDIFSNSTEDICGHFYESQLNRNLQYSYINSVFMKFAMGFILTAGGLVSVNAQGNITSDTVKAEKIEEVVLYSVFRKKQTQSMVAGAATVISEKELTKAKENLVQETPGNPGLIVNRAPKDLSGRKQMMIGGAHSSLNGTSEPLIVMNKKIRQ